MAFQKSIGFAIFFVGLTTMVLGFQNCAQSGFGQALGDPNPGASGFVESASTGEELPTDTDGGVVLPGLSVPTIVPGTTLNAVTINGEKLCPGNSNLFNNSCLKCSNADFFSAQAGGCVQKCPTGSNFNPFTSRCISCANGSVWTGITCIVPPAGCEGGLEEIRQTDANATFLMPAKTGNVCYVTKAFGAVPRQPSSTSRTRMTHVRARNLFQSNDTVWANPLIVGEKAINVYMQGPYQVIVASSPKNSGEMMVDNFLLLDVTKASSHRYVGVGTANAQYRAPDGTAIRVYDPLVGAWSNLSYTVTGNDGVLPALDITEYTEVNSKINIRLSVLDCGGEEASSDGYLFFK